jgi:site-specific recombinase XerD
MNEHLEEYANYLYQEELSESTIEIYMREAKRFLEYVGERELSKMLLIEYKKYMQDKNYSVKTVNQHIIAVNRYLKYCGHGDYVITTNRIQKNTSVNNVIDDSDYRKMLKYTKDTGDDKYYAIMKTLAITGIRVSELKYITVENIDLGHIAVNNKGKVRDIYIPDCLIDILKKYCVRSHIIEGNIFTGKKGNPISRMAVWSKINNIARRAGIEKRKGHPHSFRHYFALLYMKNYANLFELADILGHSSLETTRIYAMATVEDKRKRMEKLDNGKI